MQDPLAPRPVQLLSDLGIPIIQPQQLIAITLEQAAANLGKVLRAGVSDAAVVPAPALGPSHDVVDITLAPVAAPYATGVQHFLQEPTLRCNDHKGELVPDQCRACMLTTNPPFEHL